MGSDVGDLVGAAVLQTAQNGPGGVSAKSGGSVEAQLVPVNAFATTAPESSLLFQAHKSWLNELAPLNMFSMSFTEVTSQPDRS